MNYRLSAIEMFNQCPASPAVHIEPVPSPDRFRFRSQSFHFSGDVNDQNQVYVHCSVKVCPARSCYTDIGNCHNGGVTYTATMPTTETTKPATTFSLTPTSDAIKASSLIPNTRNTTTKTSTPITKSSTTKATKSTSTTKISTSATKTSTPITKTSTATTTTTAPTTKTSSSTSTILTTNREIHRRRKKRNSKTNATWSQQQIQKPRRVSKQSDLVKQDILSVGPYILSKVS
ncbi:hypothetical protein ElyMa_002460900 [Elysia marginata]|uniref:ZP domain-containing protein n=1 Tax=Elysia marginata TaxID=1093978 RepID=A0AAV4GPB2_9GAST|nr:hypothetical protein ElyMa_002460900 [Elysia marginata]